MIITECDQVKDDSKWSNLPNLLLWMIKARLDYPNSARFASVCKHWLHASTSYPLLFKDDYELDNSPPWIMLYKSLADNRREFVSVLTKERYTIENPDFIASAVIYSRQGWLLLNKLQQHKNGRCIPRLTYKNKCDSPYLLLNPFKNLKFMLPPIDINTFRGTFNIQDGNPNCIVLGKNDREVSLTVKIYITYRDDNVWRCYSYTTGEFDLTSVFVNSLFIIENVVYIPTLKARVFVFNITHQQWQDHMLESSDFSNLTLHEQQYMMLTKGEILRLYFPKGVGYKDFDFVMPKCYKLNTGENVHWELIDDRVLAPTCVWFLSRPYTSFGRCFVSRVNEVHGLVKLGKGVRKKYLIRKIRRNNTFAYCYSDIDWVHM